MGHSGGRVLDFDQIPIERHWGISIRLHEALGHTEPWEICQDGCDRLASEAIYILFDEPLARAEDHTPLRGQFGATPKEHT